MLVEKFLEKNNLPETLSGGTLKWAMIEFAKMHVEAALKAASENADTKDVPYTDDIEVDKDSILYSYPLANIK